LIDLLLLLYDFANAWSATSALGILFLSRFLSIFSAILAFLPFSVRIKPTLQGNHFLPIAFCHLRVVYLASSNTSSRPLFLSFPIMGNLIGVRECFQSTCFSATELP
jgi:hypothetical protein